VTWKHTLPDGQEIDVHENEEISGVANEDEGWLSVDCRSKGKARLHTHLHELLHLILDAQLKRMPAKVKHKVMDDIAANVAEYLWKAGYRRRK